MDYKEHFHSLIDEGNFEEAFAYLKKFSGYAYEDPFYFANMGWLYNQFHEYEQAKSCLLTGLRLFAQDGWMCAQLGCTYNRCMEYELALNCFEQALALDFDEPWLHYEMCVAYRELDQPQNAYEEIENALLEVPEHCGYLEECGDLLIAMERHAQAAEVFEQAFSISGEPYDQMMMAECMEKDGRYEAALSLYAQVKDEALQRDVALHSGICLFGMEKDAEALEQLERSRQLGRDDTLLYQYLGRVWLRLGKEETADAYFLRALHYYERALEINEDRRWLYQEMIALARYMHDHQPLYDLLEQGLKEYGDEAWMRYQAAHAFSDDERYERSIALIQDTPAALYSSEFDYLLAHDLGRIDRRSEAIAVLEKLRRQYPQDTWVLCEYGWNLSALDHFDQAAELFRSALAIEPDAYCEAMLGWCLYHLEAYAEAETHLRISQEMGLRESWVDQVRNDCANRQLVEEH